MYNQGQFAKIPHPVSILLVICASKAAHWGNSLHSTAHSNFNHYDSQFYYNTFRKDHSKVTFKRHLIKYSAVREIQWERFTGIVIKGSRDVNNLYPQAIYLILHTDIVMKYYTEGLAIQPFG